MSEKPSFLIPTKSITFETATAGLLFHELSNRQLTNPQSFKTFFASSQYEAFFGTVKIMRANMKGGGKVIGVFETCDHYAFLSNPFETEEPSILAPGILFFQDPEMIKKALSNGVIHGLIVHIRSEEEYRIAQELFEAACATNVLSALSKDSEFENSSMVFQKFNPGPDIIIYSESFTNWQIPFGCFSMNERAFEPWNNFTNCLTHSSTYSGNMITLSYAIQCIYQKFPDLPYPKYPTFKDVVLGFHKYVNPKVAILYQAFNLAPNVVRAKGAWLEVKRKKNSIERILDCLGNSGCGSRGHNPEDLIDNVINTPLFLDNPVDQLQEQLHKLTGLSQFCMTTSGARAVDLALVMARQQLGKPLRVISFTNNYSGKTLGALSVTFYEGYKNQFYPLYSEVHFVDPRSGTDKVTQLIEEKGINFAWIELLQGDSLDKISSELVDCLKDLQLKGKILIGIDEILTGGFRTGSFLLSEQFDLKPDFVTLSKALTDISFPFACVCYTEKLIDHPSLEALKKMDSNSLGAAIALNVLKGSTNGDLTERVKKRSSELKLELERVCKKSKWIRSVKGEGLLLFIEPNEEVFPISILGKDLFGFFLSSYLINYSNVFLFNCRLTPPLNFGDEESQFLINQLDKSLSKLTTLRLLRFLGVSIFMILIKAGKDNVAYAWKNLKKLKK
ncbi:MAG: aminotransferase class III-fold pyridoxal phosphate-dependent enzyme [Verrucomicrobia bacterium]|nr:aminotransferase class III-fold pyridoxal phosphate-dependent enzyme [Verrucomicrobiota bacterium]